MKLLSVIFVMFCAFGTCLANSDSLRSNHEIDSFVTLLSLTEPMELRAQYSNEIAKRYYYLIDNRTSDYWSQALRLCEQVIDENKSPSENLFLQFGRALNGHGLLASRSRQYEEAMQYYVKAQEQYERINDQVKVSVILYNIGNIHTHAKLYDKARLSFQKALQIRLSSQDSFAIVNCYNKLAEVEVRTQNFELGRQYGNIAKELSEHIQYYRGQIEAHIILAKYCTSEGQLEDALKKYISIQELISKSGRPIYEAENLYRLGRVSIDLNQLDQAKIYLEKAVMLSVAENPPGAPKYFKYLSAVYDKLGNKKLAYSTIQRGQAAARHIKANEKLIAAETYLHTYQHEQQNELHKLVIQQEQFRKKVILWASIGALLLLVLLGVILLSKHKQRAKAREKILELEVQNNELKATKLNEQIAQKQEDIQKLIIHASASNEHNKMIYQALEKMLPEADSSFSKYLRNIMTDLRGHSQQASSREMINSHIDIVNSEFDSELKSQYPSLSKLEREICAYIKIGMTTKEIMEVKLASRNAIKSTRHRIRTKMKLQSGEDIVDKL